VLLLRRALLLTWTTGLAACGGSLSFGIPAFELTGQVVVADLDGDGRADVAATVSLVDGPPPHAGRVRVWLQRADAPGGFAAPVDHAVGPDPTALRVADLDGDRVPDLLAMSTQASAQPGPAQVDAVTVLRGDPSRPGGFLPGLVLRAGTRLADIAVGDLDGDGGPDIAFTGHGDDARVGVWWNRTGARGSFEPPVTLVPGAAGALVTADLDADGRPDLLYAAGGQVWLLARDAASARAFRAPAAVGVEALHGRLATADLDRDGLVDLVLTTRERGDFGSPGAVVTLRNDPARPGHFTPLQTLPSRVHAHDLAVTDLDGNGWPDIVTTAAGVYPQFFDDLLEVFLDQHGAVPGRFAPAVGTVSAGTSSGWWITAADLDADGRPEVLMPLGGSVLLWRRDPVHPGRLLRWRELGR
jgi:hypothetical protein